MLENKFIKEDPENRHGRDALVTGSTNWQKDELLNFEKKCLFMKIWCS